MAIIPYTREGQTCYRIKCETGKGSYRVQKQRDAGCVSNTVANQIYRQLQREVQSESLRLRSQGQTWRALLAAFHRAEVLNGKCQTSTNLDHYNALMAHTKAWLNTPAEHLTPEAVGAVFYEMTEKGLGKSRTKAIRSGINVIFEWAQKVRLLPPHVRSPAKGVTAPKTERKKQPVLSKMEIQTLLRKARDLEHPFFPIWAVAASTGCRSGELYALRWSDVNFERDLIHVGRSFSNRLGREKSTKTGNWRDVPMNEELKKLLTEMKLRAESGEWVLPRITSWRRGEASKVLREFCERIGISPVTFHSLRACFAVQCLESGLDVGKTMKLGGWEQMKSFQHYIRLAGVEIRGATDGIHLLPRETAPAKVLELRRP